LNNKAQNIALSVNAKESALIHGIDIAKSSDVTTAMSVEDGTQKK